MRKKLFAGTVATALGAAVALAAPAVATTNSTPASVGNVTPVVLDSPGPGGNATCAQVGLEEFGDADYYEFTSDRVAYDSDGDTFDVPFPAGVTVTVTDDKSVAFESEFAVGAVIVKGGDGANIYVYDPQDSSDSGLTAPLNARGKPVGLGNLTFCWNPAPQDPEWCSPGFWRQDHHLDAWEATGISPDELYRDHVGSAPDRTNKGVADGASADPTLWQVLQAPQHYGGDAFNMVGDLLSDAHPDVAFTGDRAEDACPLS
jgi:hypothetical protein